MRTVKRERRGRRQMGRRSDMINLWSERKCIVVSAIVGCVVGIGATAATVGINHARSTINPITANANTPATLGTLLTMTQDQLKTIDIARLNLLSAQGLPGAEKLDIPAALTTIDQWAAKVKQETDRHLYRSIDPTWADHYGHSQAKLRAEMLVQVLQEDLGVHYNMERVEKIDFTNSKDLFIRGMIA